MRHLLHIQLRTAEGAVIRALGLIERRGFRIETVHAGEAQGDGQAMTVTVSGERPADLLQRQLERLHDVLWVDRPDEAVQWGGQDSTHTTTSGARPFTSKT